MSVPWIEGKQLISNEEKNLRWDLFEGKIKMSEVEFNKRIKGIRKRTGKP